MNELWHDKYAILERTNGESDIYFVYEGRIGKTPYIFSHWKTGDGKLTNVNTQEEFVLARKKAKTKDRNDYFTYKCSDGIFNIILNKNLKPAFKEIHVSKLMLSEKTKTKTKEQPNLFENQEILDSITEVFYSPITNKKERRTYKAVQKIATEHDVIFYCKKEK